MDVCVGDGMRGLHPPTAPFGKQLHIDRTRLIRAKAIMKREGELVQIVMLAAAGIGLIQKWTMQAKFSHSDPLVEYLSHRQSLIDFVSGQSRRVPRPGSSQS